MKFYHKHRDLIDCIVVFLLVTLCTYYDYFEYGIATDATIKTLALHERALYTILEKMFMFYALIAGLRTPVLAQLALIISLMSNFMYYRYSNVLYAATQMRSDLIWIMMTCLAMIIYMYVADKKQYPENMIRNDSINKRFLNDITFEDLPKTIPLWSLIICYSMIVSLVGVIANNTEEYNNYGAIKYYLGFSSVLSTLMMIGIFTVSNLTYQLLLLEGISEIIALIMLNKYGGVSQSAKLEVASELIIIFLILERYLTEVVIPKRQIIKIQKMQEAAELEKLHKSIKDKTSEEIRKAEEKDREIIKKLDEEKIKQRTEKIDPEILKDGIEKDAKNLEKDVKNLEKDAKNLESSR